MSHFDQLVLTHSVCEYQLSHQYPSSLGLSTEVCDVEYVSALSMYTPSPMSRKASSNIADRNMVKSMWASTQSCLTSFVTLDVSETKTSPPTLTFAIIPVYRASIIAVNFSGHPYFLSSCRSSGSVHSILPQLSCYQRMYPLHMLLLGEQVPSSWVPTLPSVHCRSPSSRFCQQLSAAPLRPFPTSLTSVHGCVFVTACRHLCVLQW